MKKIIIIAGILLSTQLSAQILTSQERQLIIHQIRQEILDSLRKNGGTVLKMMSKPL